MMSWHKSDRLAMVNFKNSVIRLFWAMVWLAVITIVVPFVATLVIEQRVALNLNISWSLVLAVAVFYLMVDALSLNYENFKWTIQNGIARRTAWLGRLKGLSLLSFVILIFDVGLRMSTGNHFLYDGLSQQPVHTPIQWITAIFIEYLFLQIMMVTSLAVGYFLALLSKRGKWIVIIGAPILGGVILVYIAHLLIHASIDWASVGTIVKAVIGYSEKTDSFNPVNIVIIMLIDFFIFLGISYIFSQKIKLRRD